MNGPWGYLAALALGCGFAVPVAVLSAALGQGRAGAAGIEGSPASRRRRDASRPL